MKNYWIKENIYIFDLNEALEYTHEEFYKALYAQIVSLKEFKDTFHIAGNYIAIYIFEAITIFEAFQAGSPTGFPVSGYISADKGVLCHVLTYKSRQVPIYKEYDDTIEEIELKFYNLQNLEIARIKFINYEKWINV